MKIIIYIFKKIIIYVLSVFILSISVFYISKMAPADPLVSYYGDRVEKMKKDERYRLEQKLGLDKPLHIQYITWLKNTINGDFGISYKYKISVVKLLKSRILNTFLLGGVGFLLIFISSLLLGIFCAVKKDSILDKIISNIGFLISCIPEFWLALILIAIFSMLLHILPSSGSHSFGIKNNIVDTIKHLILPVGTLVLGHLWYYAFIVRSMFVSELQKDYVLLARIKGVTVFNLIFKHCLRNMLPAYLSLMVLSIPHIMYGTYIVEIVFSYNGLGTLAYESACFKDYNLLMLIVILSGIIVMTCNSVVDIINERIDYRMKDYLMVDYDGTM